MCSLLYNEQTSWNFVAHDAVDIDTKYGNVFQVSWGREIFYIKVKSYFSIILKEKVLLNLFNKCLIIMLEQLFLIVSINKINPFLCLHYLCLLLIWYYLANIMSWSFYCQYNKP